jgi:hypothetical protein
MNRQKLLMCASLCLSLCSVGLLRGQGLYIETARSGKSGVDEKMYYMPKMFKSVNKDDSEITILRFDRETIYQLNPSKKTYTAMTFAEMKAMFDGAHSALEDMLAKRLASAPPAEQERLRKAMEAMKGRSPGAAITHEVIPVGEHKTIAGYACDKYIVKRNGKESETVWATKQVSGFESMKRDMEGFVDRLSSMFGRETELSTWLKKIDGFPIQTESDGNVSTVKTIDHRSIPVSEFEVPAGYTLEKKGMFGGDESGQ